PTRDADEKAVESRLEEGCYYLLFDSRSRVGAMPEVRRWISSRFTPARLLHRAAPHYQRLWFPAYGLLPRWHHAPQIPEAQKPAGLERLTLTFYGDHNENRI
ncbi:transcriptional regulator SgrR, partial [Leptospira borgpetersenii serovar Ballum]|nr:transcriptional regulator SgrR [Leptospira borgpetersenii serovar Ballum]